MWLFTRYGFFSVVFKPIPAPKGSSDDFFELFEAREFSIRSRERSHLENLLGSVRVKGRWPGDLDEPEILKEAGTDYEYRIRATKKEWRKFWAPTLFGSIDYPNFKSKVHELVQEGSVPREYEDLLADVYFDCLPQREKEYSFEAAKDRV